MLKFNPGPETFSHDQFVELKRRVISAAVKHDCKLLVNLVLHDIARSSEEARRNGINTLCFHFDCFLNRPKVGGLVLIDRFSDKQIDRQLAEKLSVGLTGQLPFSKELKLQHILGCHYTAIGQSHFCSLVDVILGSLRFAINAFTQRSDQHAETSRNILNQLSPLFFREGSDQVHSISFWFSPATIKHAGYRERYVALKAYLEQNGVSIAQEV